MIRGLVLPSSLGAGVSRLRPPLIALRFGDGASFDGTGAWGPLTAVAVAVGVGVAVAVGVGAGLVPVGVLPALERREWFGDESDEEEGGLGTVGDAAP